MWGLRVIGTRSRGHAVHETPGLKRALFYFKTDKKVSIQVRGNQSPNPIIH